MLNYRQGPCSLSDIYQWLYGDVFYRGSIKIPYFDFVNTIQFVIVNSIFLQYQIYHVSTISLFTFKKSVYWQLLNIGRIKTLVIFLFIQTATTQIYTLSLHYTLPLYTTRLVEEETQHCASISWNESTSRQFFGYLSATCHGEEGGVTLRVNLMK